MIDSKAHTLPGLVGMALGMLKGFIVGNIGKMPEEVLYQQMHYYSGLMMSWVNDDAKHE